MGFVLQKERKNTMTPTECLTTLWTETTGSAFIFTSLANTSNVTRVPHEYCLTFVDDSICCFLEVWGVPVYSPFFIITIGHWDAFRNNCAVLGKNRHVCIGICQIPELVIMAEARYWANYVVLICRYGISWTNYKGSSLRLRTLRFVHRSWLVFRHELQKWAGRWGIYRWDDVHGSITVTYLGYFAGTKNWVIEDGVLSRAWQVHAGCAAWWRLCWESEREPDLWSMLAAPLWWTGLEEIFIILQCCSDIRFVVEKRVVLLWREALASPWSVMARKAEEEKAVAIEKGSPIAIISSEDLSCVCHDCCVCEQEFQLPLKLLPCCIA